MELYLHYPSKSSWRGAQLKSKGTTLPLPLNDLWKGLKYSVSSLVKEEAWNSLQEPMINTNHPLV